MRLIVAGLVQFMIICSATTQSEASSEEKMVVEGLWEGLMESMERPCRFRLRSTRKTLIFTSLGVFYPIITWAIIFTLTSLLLLTLGFGPTGVAAGIQHL